MVTTQDVRFPVEGGQMRAALALPDHAEGAVPGLLVLHELFGLNDDIRRIAARFAENGYAALAPDLYSVGPPRPICILRTMQAMNSGSGRVFDDLEAGQRWLAERPEVDGSRVGVAGFCMGGSFAILHAVRAPVGAAAAFYARVPRTVEELDGICPVVAGYGERDKMFIGQPPRLREHLDRLGVAHDVEVYPDAGHSYMNQHHMPRPVQALMRHARMSVGYHHDSAEDSWRRMLKFLSEHLAA